MEIDLVQMQDSGLLICSLHNFKILLDILSYPNAFLDSEELVMLFISAMLQELCSY
jgi:hypothetical protein